MSENQQQQNNHNERQFLTFNLADQLYGVDILSVKEILEYGGISEIPLVPDYISGVLNLRGNVVPVIDLKARFNWGKSAETKLSCIIIVETKSENDRVDLGIMVDSVNEVTSLYEDEIQETPNFGAKIRLDFISSIGKKDGKFVIILNVENVLSIEELAQFGEHINNLATSEA